jgi:hypothetical protein
MNNKELGFQHCQAKTGYKSYLKKLTNANKLNHSALWNTNSISHGLTYQRVVKKSNNLSSHYRFSNNNANGKFACNKLRNNADVVITVTFFAF